MSNNITKVTLADVLSLYACSADVVSTLRREIEGNYHETKADPNLLRNQIGGVFKCINGLTKKLPGGTLELVMSENLEKTYRSAGLELNQGTPTLQSYTADSRITDRYGDTKKQGDNVPNSDKARVYCCGLIKEIGEIADIFGENMINGKPLMEEDISTVREKLGDALWYLNAICNNKNLKLCEVAKTIATDEEETVSEHKKDTSTDTSSDITFQAYKTSIQPTLAEYVRKKDKKGKLIEFAMGLFEEGAEVTAPILQLGANVDTQDLGKEIGDVLWYITMLSSEISETSLEQVARGNIKLVTNDNPAENLTNESDMPMSQYSTFVQNTYRANLPEEGEKRNTFFALGLIKEIGKLSELYGEHIIDDTPLDNQRVTEKLGATLWYATAIANSFGLNIANIAETSIKKTKGRYDENGHVKPHDGDQLLDV